MPYPALDIPALKLHSVMPSADIDYLESQEPGYIAQQIENAISFIYGRLRKRYANSLPFGSVPPPLEAQGSNPPALLLTGVPTLGSQEYRITVPTPGGVGVGVLSWSSNKGLTKFTLPYSAQTLFLTGTGVTLNIPTGSVFVGDEAYASTTVIPAIILRWAAAIATRMIYGKRGYNQNDPTLAEMVVKEYETVLSEIKEAADSKDGLFDLPVNDDSESNVSSGFVLGCSQASPYTASQIERCRARLEDEHFSEFESDAPNAIVGGD